MWTMYGGIPVSLPCSKNQLKKQRKLAKYMETRKERRLREKDRQKQRRKELLAKGLPLHVGPSRKELKRRQITSESSSSENVRIAIDLDYDDIMLEHDIAKCVKQCLRIYTINRNRILSEKSAQLHFTGIKTDGNIHAAFKKNHGWENWHLKFHTDESHLDAFPKEQFLDVKDVYVIGGLVDHNHHKNLCHACATKVGLRTALFEILIRVAEGNSWIDAILQTVPPRKGAKPEVLQSDMKDERKEESVVTNGECFVNTLIPVNRGNSDRNLSEQQFIIIVAAVLLICANHIILTTTKTAEKLFSLEKKKL
uniref:tRNA (guanine(9)-N(1))-methyltransferase n=1 Tax=Glossina pallidipes TaxID=7398 RepID=A0A1B0A9I1_GLOPL